MSDHGQMNRLTAPRSAALDLLERLTACVLVLVVLALAWMLVVSYQPDWLRLTPAASEAAEGPPSAPPDADRRPARSEEVEVVIILGIVTLALGLVTIVSLLHTRRR